MKKSKPGIFYYLIIVILLGFGILSLGFIAVGCGTGGGGGDTTTTTTSTTSTTATPSFSLASPVFVNNGIIPDKYGKAGATTGGTDTSVPLSWLNAPAGTNYFALSMVDTNLTPDTAHWLVVNIPSSQTYISEGASPASTPGTEVKNDYTSGQYEGPWPGAGNTHTYLFTIYALSNTVDATAINNSSDPLTTFNSAVSTNLGTATLSGDYTD